MKLDFGEVLTRSFQITWKHKIFWLFSALPTLLSFIIFPFVFVPVFFMDQGYFGDPFFLESPLYVILFVVVMLFIALLSYVLYGVSSSAVMLGTVRTEGGAESFTFRELFNDSKPYWWRVLGVLLLVGLGIFIVFAVIFGCFVLVGAVTAGLGFLCLQPLMLLMYPLMMVVYGMVEVAQVGVVADDLGVTDSIRRGWDLVRENFWRVTLISLIVYLIFYFFSFIITLPIMAVFFFVPLFMLDSGPSAFDPRTMMLFAGGISLLFFPFMALVQGVGMTFMKSAFTLVYLRLSKPQENTPIVLEENA